GIARPLAAAQKPRAVLLAGFDVAEDAIVLHFAHDRAHGGGGIGWNAGLVALDGILHAFEHGVVDLLVDEGAAGPATGLPPPTEIHAIDDRGRDRVEIGVRANDQRH